MRVVLQVLLLGALTRAALGLTRYVAGTGNDDSGNNGTVTPWRTIHHAFDHAQDGDVVVLNDNELYHLNDHLHADNSFTLIVKSLFEASEPVDPDFASYAIIDCRGIRGGLYFKNVNSTVRGVWIRNCVEKSAIEVQGNVYSTVSNVLITNSPTMKFGGGVNINTGIVTMEYVDIRNCTALAAGGAVFVYGSRSVSMHHCHLSGNSAFRGGALYATASIIHIEDSVFEWNSANTDGGAMGFTFATVTVARSNISHNMARTGSGAGAHYESSDYSMNHCRLVNNAAPTGQGGAIKAVSHPTEGAAPVIQHTMFKDNIAYNGACAAVHQGFLRFAHVEATGNSASSGGCVYVFHDGEFEDLSGHYYNNSARQFGAVGHVLDGKYSTNHTLYEHNIAQIGGALDVAPDAQLFVFDCDFRYNRVFTESASDASVSIGGGACISMKRGFASIQSSRFSHGWAFVGGAISTNEGTLEIIDSVFMHNNASLYGGSIYIRTSPLVLRNLTFSSTYTPFLGKDIYFVDTDHTSLLPMHCPGCMCAPTATSAFRKCRPFTSKPYRLDSSADALLVQSHATTTTVTFSVKDYWNNTVFNPQFDYTCSVFFTSPDGLFSPDSFNLSHTHRNYTLDVVGDIGSVYNLTFDAISTKHDTLAQELACSDYDTDISLQHSQLVLPVEILGCREDQMAWQDTIQGRHYTVCKQGQMQYVPDALFIGVCCVCCLLAAMIFALIGVVTVNRKSAIFRASSYQFLVTFLIGCLVSLLSVIISGLMETERYNNDSRGSNAHMQAYNNFCNALTFTFSIGYDLCVGSLVVKTYRIHSLFNSDFKTLYSRTKAITNARLFGYLMLLVGTEICVHVVWILIEPLHREVTISGSLDDVHGRASCVGDHVLVFLITILVMKAIVLLYGLYLSFQVRDVEMKFNESRQLGFAMYNAGLYVLVFTFNFFLVSAPSTKFLVSSVLLILFISASTSVLFIPKLRVLYVDKSDSVVSSAKRSGRWLRASPSTVVPRSGPEASNVQVTEMEALPEQQLSQPLLNDAALS